MPPVTFTFDANRIGESSTDCNVILIPRGPGPNKDVECQLKSASERSFQLGLAGDHIMAANNIGPVAVAQTEAKPQGAVGGMHPREWRRLTEFMGGVRRPFDIRWIINRPGLPVDTYDFEGCVMTGDVGEERNTGSLPVTAFDFLIVDPQLNGRSLLRDPSEST